MAQPNVAREPSMDEILASIRRIIESNEPPVGAPGPLVAAEAQDAAADSFDDEIIIADFHAEESRLSPAEQLARPAIAPVQPETSPPHPAMSLADVAARVRAASERNGMMLRQGEPAGPAQGTTPAGPFETIGTSPAAVVNGAGRQASAAPTGFEQPRPAAHEHVTSSTHQETLSSAAVSLVSPAVSAQVSGSFGVLAEAVQAEPRRSFDEIAEEMLRPMLQEWLDDNLPTLVERLVREEIERVARGPRR
ncbi:PopZ family protein [Mycoplana dimorpha]|nr:PopZ family protein [Mycoplana dimorpha]